VLKLATLVALVVVLVDLAAVVVTTVFLKHVGRHSKGMNVVVTACCDSGVTVISTQAVLKLAFAALSAEMLNYTLFFRSLLKALPHLLRLFSKGVPVVVPCISIQLQWL